MCVYCYFKCVIWSNHSDGAVFLSLFSTKQTVIAQETNSLFQFLYLFLQYTNTMWHLLFDYIFNAIVGEKKLKPMTKDTTNQEQVTIQYYTKAYTVILCLKLFLSTEMTPVLRLRGLVFLATRLFLRH